ncbi:Shedu immune nuclease family protein [Delftia sp. ASV31]|uniref:Shedu immune nuclease family protein n=1 Tax=Delftia sp. ASV31 TaxID=2795113 RepID=UPI0018EA99FD|nr:Shedu immune nuclease family protein [Delftia sp. ASV31]
MDDEAEIHRKKIPGKTYISPAVATAEGPLRIASKVIDSEGLHYAKVKQEVVLRHTQKGRTEIIAKFLESDRDLRVVTLQAFNGSTGVPHNTHFSFIGNEIPTLLRFFQDIAAVEFNGPQKVNITDSELRRLVLSKEQAANLVHDNQEVFAEVVQAELTKEDVVTLGYRKKQLAIFQRLLEDAGYFDQVKQAKHAHGDEALWQMFFEKNQWVFGYGLSYFFVTGFDDRKLEQVVQGHDLLSHGKRADGLMKTRGIINALCFVEIKKHNTPLLDASAYRSGCWAPSSELAGAVAQVQGTVAAAMQRLYGLIQPNDKDGNPTGESVFNFRPRAFIVAGSLSEFVSEHGVNTDKMRSFELYRNSIAGIDIMTFDELYERSKFIVEAAAMPTSSS